MSKHRKEPAGVQGKGRNAVSWRLGVIRRLEHDRDGAFDTVNWQYKANVRLSGLMFVCHAEMRPPTMAEINDACA